MRSVRFAMPLVAVGLLALTGCPPKTKQPETKPPPPPPPAKGDLLRVIEKKGDAPKGTVKLMIEQRAPGKKGKLQQVQLNFDFSSEERVEGVAPDGAQVTARLLDAVGTPTMGAKQEAVDAFSVALDEMKISFKRTNRADVTDLVIRDVKKPLDEQTAKNVVVNIFGALRGAVLPEAHVEPGATWKVEAPIPGIGNFTGQVGYTYSYARKEGTLAVVVGEGVLEGRAGSGANMQKLTGRVSAELRVDLSTGKLAYSMVDTEQKVTREPTGDTLYEQHFKSEWTAKP